MTPTLPAPYSQGDGSPKQWSNCLLACETMKMHRGSVGRWRVPASRLRTITGDTSGGVTLDQAADASYDATNGEVRPDVRYDIDRTGVKTLVQSGRGLTGIVAGWVYVNTRRATNGFRGNHGLYANAYRESKGGTDCRCELRESRAESHKFAHGEYYIKDPGVTSTGFRWWSASLFYRSLEKGAAAGSKVIDVSVTRDTEGVTRKGRIRAPITAAASGSAKKLGYTKAGQDYGVASTVDGTMWRRTTDGGESDNYHRIHHGTGFAFVWGKALA